MESKKVLVGVPDSIRDLVAGAPDSSVFYEYEDKQEIGLKIFEELCKRFNQKGRRGFYMTDNNKEIGVLSQCQSLNSLLELAYSFGLDFDNTTIKDKNKKGQTLSIRDIMDIVIEDILDKITVTDGIFKTYRFDASPFESELFTSEYSYIDAITWVVPTFLQVLKFHASIREICQWEDQLIDVIVYSVNYLNDSFINGSTEEDKLKVGWNFTKDCEEPSLYFSFAVCECLLAYRNTFEKHLNYQQAVALKNDKERMEISAELQADHDKHVEEFNIMDKMEQPVQKEGEKPKAKYDEYNELVRVYKRLNNGLETIEGTAYGTLQKNCMLVAQEVWRLVRDKNLADNFFSNDLNKVITENEIAISTTNDALFNTVYIINIMINAGLDKFIRTEQAIAQVYNYTDEYDRRTREYNELFENCQLALQKAFRVYENLKKNSKEYIVDQFLVGFNESFKKKHLALTNELRKRRIRVFSLTPMLVRTNNIISEYLVKYPQATMQKYLGYILENRYIQNNSLCWIWESDGFFSASNYYFISALGGFYAYYEKYESAYLANSKNNKDFIDDVKKQHAEEIKVAQIDPLRLQIEEQKAEIKALREKRNPIEDAVKEVIKSEFENLLPELICAFLKDAASDYSLDSADGSNSAYRQFHEVFGKYMLTFFNNDICRIANEEKSDTLRQNKYKELKSDVETDIARCISAMVNEIASNTYHKSSLFESDN